jgi:hypothetical protein
MSFDLQDFLGISPITFMRDWTTAKACLSRALGKAAGSRQ